MVRRRVVVLGGGCAGSAAAEELTSTEARRARFDVIVVQPGFRLGGKGATGRNPLRGHRIEEHGMHVWMGFYRRSFRMMRRVLEEWDAPASVPIRTIENAFAPDDRCGWVGNTQSSSGGLDVWGARLPPRPGRPWDDDAGSIDWTAFGRELFRFGTRGIAAAAGTIREEGPDVRRRLAVLGRLSLAASKGLLRDVLPHGEAGFDRIDDQDLRAWLRRHGAEEADVEGAPVLRGIYDLCFSYPDGVPGAGRGRIAAGAALKSILLILGAYRGAPFWRMRAGMGDTIFAPLHQVLRARGVRFAFFQRAHRLRPEANRLASITLRAEARPRAGAYAYEPLVDVGGQPCWPHAPLRDQIEEADSESTLERGRDFDDAILAVPAPAQGHLAEALAAANERYRAMLDGTHSVATRAAQLWLAPSRKELGWTGAPIVTGAPGLFSSWGDMTEVAASEQWPERPGTIAYFCDACPDGWTERDLLQRIQRWADEELTTIFPLARGEDGRFRRELLLAGREEGALAAQYFRVNRDPSERYVLSLPGTTKVRLRPDESGFENLYLAGDWTRTRINGGSVEAAVESGQEAARAICRKYGVA